MSSSDEATGINNELSLWDNVSNAKIFIQWLIVLILMGAINLILNKSYGPLKDNFFCVSLNGKYITPKRLMLVFTLLIYIVIVGVREWTKKVIYSGTTLEERTEGFKDFILYILITLVSFTYASAYIRRKFNTGSGQEVKMGGGNEGILGDTVSKISSTGFGTLTLYIGIVVVIINVISNTYQYLKNKERNQKDKMLRTIYFSQISTMIIFLITSLFVAGFGCSELQGGNFKTIGLAFIKWITVITLSILGIHLINISTGGENWFGDPKNRENEGVNSR